MEDEPRFAAQPTVDVSLEGLNGYSLYLRWKEGDKTAFTKLWDRYGELVYKISLKRLGNIDDALDACQETFIALTGRKIPEIPTENQWRRYLGRIANNRAIDVWRRLNRHEECSYTEDAEEIGGDGLRINVKFEGKGQIFPEEEVMRRFQEESPERAVYRHELRRIIQEAIEELSNPDHRREVRLVYLEERTCREAAEELRIPYATLKTHMMRARGYLRRNLRRLGVENLMDML